jgi:predicted glycogen debranching enzyme
MSKLTRNLHFSPYFYDQCALDPHDEAEKFLRTEWIVANGLGGYASSSISGITTRKYHGVLVSALPPPFGRTIMLNHLAEQAIFPDGKEYWLGCEERAEGTIHLDGMQYLKEFRLDMGMPVWLFEVNGLLIEKRIVLVYMQNTVHVLYRMLTPGGKVTLKLHPSIHFRPHEAPVSLKITDPYVITAVDNRYEISTTNFPPLRLQIHGQEAKFTLESKTAESILFRIESRRGYEFVGDLWKPGYLKVDLSHGHDAALVASTETWTMIQALSPEDVVKAETIRREYLLLAAPEPAKQGIGNELVLAADQFIITPASRIEDAARARATGDEIRTIIAGYHWFTDWGRDTMISLEGLTLSTGRYHEARWILRTFAHYVRDGLIPNMFPEGQKDGLYHTADATLWFFHALNRYTRISKERETLKLILPTLVNIIEHHIKGTRFGIEMDPRDGLLKQGADGYQLTWMDAKVGDWVVTPRRGKAVEINALWYNALRLMQEWMIQEKNEASAQMYKEHADRAHQSFNEQFWFEEGGYLYDLIDKEGGGKDPACRPNQIFAISLDHPVLDRNHWETVVNVVQSELLTPYGLRTLSARHSDYKSRYDGDLRARDAAYHQGTVWPWLIGPFIDAWIKLHPHEREEARKFLAGFEAHLSDAGVGTISEICDAVEPYTPRGCIAQAWSIAEVLRCWLKTAPKPH